MIKINIFIDASCANIKKDKAGIGIFIPLFNICYSEKLTESKYELINKKIIKKDQHIFTNNRAEFYAFCKLYEIISHINCNVNRSIFKIYSDSNLLVKTINEWINNWIEKDILHTKKNNDLLRIIKNIKEDKTFNFKIKHIKAYHNKQEIINIYQKGLIDEKKLYLHLCNYNADLLSRKI